MLDKKNKYDYIIYIKKTKGDYKMNAQQIVEIRKIEDQINMAARRGDLKEVFAGYAKINEIINS